MLHPAHHSPAHIPSPPAHIPRHTSPGTHPLTPGTPHKHRPRRHARTRPGVMAALPSPPLPALQELANTAWALAALQMRPSPAWMRSWCDACDARWHLFKPQELCALLWGCGGLGWRGVSPLWLQRALRAHQLLLPGCGPQELVMGLWGLSQAWAPPAATAGAREAGGASSASVHLSSPSCTSAEPAVHAPHTAEPVAAAPPPSVLSVAAAACSGEWGHAFAAAAQPQLPRFSGAELATLMSALAALRGPPGAALQAGHTTSSTVELPSHTSSSCSNSMGGTSATPTPHATLYPPGAHHAQPSPPEAAAPNPGDSSSSVTCAAPCPGHGPPRPQEEPHPAHPQHPSSRAARPQPSSGMALQGETAARASGPPPRRLRKGAPLLSLALPVMMITARAARARIAGPPPDPQARSSPALYPSPQPLQAPTSDPASPPWQPQPHTRKLQQPPPQPLELLPPLPNGRTQPRHAGAAHHVWNVSGSQPPAQAGQAEGAGPGPWEGQGLLPAGLGAAGRSGEQGDAGRSGRGTGSSRFGAGGQGRDVSSAGSCAVLGPREACCLLRSAAGLQLKPGLAARAWVEAMVTCAVGGPSCNARVSGAGVRWPWAGCPGQQCQCFGVEMHGGSGGLIWPGTCTGKGGSCSGVGTVYDWEAVQAGTPPLRPKGA